MKKLGYSYLRFSSPAQLKGDSQRRQLERSRAWCEENAVKLLEEFKDHGVSAFRSKNRMLGVLSRFLSLVREGKIEPGSLFIIENVDRLSRDKVLEALSLYLEIIQAGISIVTLIDNQVHSRESIQANPIILQMAIASMARANEESEVKSVRIGDAWAESRRLALEGKAAPMGRLPCWMKRDRKTRDPGLVPSKAKIVKYVFELAAAGNNPYLITRELNDKKMPPLTNRGKSNCWSGSSVRKLLKSKSACGTLVIHEPYLDEDGKRKLRKLGERENYYPAAVSRELFAKVATILRGRMKRSKGRRGGTKASKKNAFSGLVRELGTGGGVRYHYSRAASGKRAEYLRAHKSIAAGKDYASFSWNYKDFQDIFVATCRLALAAPSKTSKEEEELAVAAQELADIREGMRELLALAKKAKSSKAALLGSLEEESTRQAEKERQVEELRQHIRSSKRARIEIPSSFEREELRGILQANVKLIEIDFKSKLFRCELYSGVRYEAWLSRENQIFVKTFGCFEIPEGAFEGITIRQKWSMRRRRRACRSKLIPV